MANVKTIAVMLIATQIALAAPAWSGEAERNQARRIHDRLTGVTASNATIDQMEILLGSDPSGKSATRPPLTREQAEAAFDIMMWAWRARGSSLCVNSISLKLHMFIEEETIMNILDKYMIPVVMGLKFWMLRLLLSSKSTSQALTVASNAGRQCQPR